jgi:vibriolysin
VSGVIQYIGELNKTYRVRLLVSSHNSDKLPCGTYNSAEIEDYSIRWSDSELNFVITTLVQENAVEFRNDTHDSRVTRWHWEFGDGTESSEPSPYHPYAQSGDYSVSLTAYDVDDAELARWDSTVPVRNHTQATIVIDYISALTVTVSASMLRYPIGTQLLWQFDDGATANAESAVHSYAASGQYDISLTLTNADYPDGLTVIQQVSVGATGLANINPAFSYQKEFQPDGTVTVNFTNTTVDPKNKSFGLWSVTWDFAEQGRRSSDETGLNQTTSMMFAGPGDYPATLTIGYRQSNAEGWSWVEQSVQKTLHLYPDPTDDYCLPVSNVTDEYIDQFTINNQLFSNGMAGGLVNPDDPIVLYSSEQNNFFIKAGYPNPDGVQYAEHYHLWIDLNQDRVFGNGNWFHDKTERLVKERDFAYTNQGDAVGQGYVAGSFRVPESKLNQAVTQTRMRILQFYANNGDLDQLDPCSDYQRFDGYGEIEDYLVHLVKPYSLSVSVEQQDNQITFTPLVDHSAIATWQWHFDDGQSSTEPNPVHRYSVPGRYQVELAVFSMEGYRLGNWQQWIDITEATVVNFDYSLSGKTIEVDGNPSQYPAGSSFVWDFGDNTGADKLVAEHTYSHAGTYKVSLTINNDFLPAGKTFSQDIRVVESHGKKGGSLDLLLGAGLLLLLLFSRMGGQNSTMRTKRKKA